MASTRNKKKLKLGNLDFVKTTRNRQDSKLNSIPLLKEDKVITTFFLNGFV